MKNQLFGNNIEPNCEYCDNFRKNENTFICIKNKEIKWGKCRKFNYNPTLREPQSEAKMMQFSKEDFDL
ncbi:MAG: hypothetical protein J1E41_00755 [Ruminococcus sp.]|nr:hypothetical protein [Ruminococcus sp.]